MFAIWQAGMPAPLSDSRIRLFAFLAHFAFFVVNILRVTAPSAFSARKKKQTIPIPTPTPIKYFVFFVVKIPHVSVFFREIQVSLSRDFDHDYFLSPPAEIFIRHKAFNPAV
jgi:hypothetical protein